MIVGTGLAFVTSAAAPAFASEGREKEPQAGSSQNRDEGAESPSKRIDKAIEDYESRSEQGLDQTRKEISRLRKELGELVELQFDLTLSLAEMRAEMRAPASDAGARAGNGGKPGSGQAPSPEEQERKRLRALELDRELRAVQEGLRAVVQQKRAETDQLISQVRNLRAQQRQIESDRAQGKKPPTQSLD
jgi:hypothetical protein